MRRRLLGLLAPLALLASCASPPHYGLPRDASPQELAEAHRLLTLAFDEWIDQTARVQRVSQRVRIAGRDLCGEELSVVMGAALLDLHRIAAELRPIALERHGSTRGLHVVAVYPGMAGEQGGLRIGDEVVSVGGQRVRKIEDLTRAWGKGADALAVAVRRGREHLELRVPTELGCPMVVRLHRTVGGSDSVQATVQRVGLVNIYSAMTRMFQDDESLALVIGHEFAHQIMKDVHHDHPYGPLGEERADYLGSYLAARAGLLPPHPERVFEQMSQDFSRLDQGSWSHPMTHERTLVLRRVAEEIARKQASGEPLVPETP